MRDPHILKGKTLAAITLAANGLVALAQTNQPADDWKPATSNERGQEFPRVNSEGRVPARLRAPDSHNVQLNISGKKFPMTMDTNGVWMGDSTPQDAGVNSVYYESPNTAHEWQTWRRSLHEFAPLVFKDQ